MHEIHDTYIVLEADRRFGDACTHLAIGINGSVTPNACRSKIRDVRAMIRTEAYSPPKMKFVALVTRQDLIGWMADRNARGLVCA